MGFSCQGGYHPLELEQILFSVNNLFLYNAFATKANRM